MKNSLFSMLSVSIFLLFLIVGCNSTPNKKLGDDIKDRDIKIYSIKITSGDDPDCEPNTNGCVNLGNGDVVSFCVTCEAASGSVDITNIAVNFTSSSSASQSNSNPMTGNTVNCSSSNPTKKYFSCSMPNNPPSSGILEITFTATPNQGNGTPFTKNGSAPICN